MNPNLLRIFLISSSHGLNHIISCIVQTCLAEVCLIWENQILWFTSYLDTRRVRVTMATPRRLFLTPHRSTAQLGIAKAETPKGEAGGSSAFWAHSHCSILFRNIRFEESSPGSFYPSAGHHWGHLPDGCFAEEGYAWVYILWRLFFPTNLIQRGKSHPGLGFTFLLKV